MIPFSLQIVKTGSSKPSLNTWLEDIGKSRYILGALIIDNTWDQTFKEFWIMGLFPYMSFLTFVGLLRSAGRHERLQERYFICNHAAFPSRLLPEGQPRQKEKIFKWTARQYNLNWGRPNPPSLLPLLRCFVEILDTLPDQMKDEATESSFLK